MNRFNGKHLPSNYKGVRGIVDRRTGQTIWVISMKINGFWVSTKAFKTEREAALAVDKKRIDMGLAPVNILKTA